MLNNNLKSITLMTLTPLLIASPLGNASPQAQHQPPIMAPVPSAEDLMPHAGSSSLTEHPDVESQVKGQYPDLERKESLPLGAIQHA